VEASKQVKVEAMAGGSLCERGGPNCDAVVAAKQKPEWQKVLYLRQPYPDNHVGKGFMDSLLLNTKLQSYRFLSLCRSASIIVQHICVSSLLMSIAVLIENANAEWPCRELLFTEMTLLSFSVAAAFLQRCSFREHLHGLLYRGGLAAGLGILSFTLRVLTRSWSKDSIEARSFSLLALHAVLYNYSASTSLLANGRVKGGPALKASMLAVALLSMQMRFLETVLFVCLATEMLVFLPATLARLRQKSAVIHDALLLPALVLSALGFLGPSIRALLLVLSIVVVAIIGPLALIAGQRYKRQIHGPWDIAFVSPALGTPTGKGKCLASPTNGWCSHKYGENS